MWRVRTAPPQPATRLRDVGERLVGGGVDEQLHALLQADLLAEALRLGHLALVRAARRHVHALVQDVHVVGHAVVVHAVERVEVVDEEVGQRAARGDGPVHLARAEDLDLGVLGQDDLLLDVGLGAQGGVRWRWKARYR